MDSKSDSIFSNLFFLLIVPNHVLQIIIFLKNFHSFKITLELISAIKFFSEPILI